MIHTLALELGPRNIRVKAINPGIMLTPMVEDALPDDLTKRLAAHTPLRRNGTPEDVSGPVAWLLSDEAAFVTGLPAAINALKHSSGFIQVARSK